MAIVIGEVVANLGLNTKGFESKLKSMEDIGTKMATRLTLPIIAGFGLVVKSASDAEETFSKFATVYRDVNDQAESSFRMLRNEYGLSSIASKQLLGDTGDLLTGFGFAQTEALRLSTEVQKLAVDLASFTNFSGGAEGASQALTKALLGERESVKALGISILEEDVKKQMAINSSKGLTFETERQAKAQATLDIAISQSQNAIGDYARTQDGFANQMRLLQSNVSDLAVEFGQILLPAARKLVDAGQTLVQVLSQMDERTKSMGLTVLAVAATGGPLLLAVAAIAKMTTVIVALNPVLLALGALMVATGAIALGMAFNIDEATSKANAQKKVVDALPDSYRAIIKQMDEYAKANGVSIDSVDEFNKSFEQMGQNLKNQASQMEGDLNKLIEARNDLIINKDDEATILNDPEKTDAEIADLNAKIEVAESRLKKYYDLIADMQAGLSTFNTPETPTTPETVAPTFKFDKNPLIEFIEGTKQVGVAFESMGEISRVTFDKMKTGMTQGATHWSNFVDTFQDLGGEFKAFLAGEISSAIISFGETIGRSLSGAEDSFATTFEKIILIVLDFAKSLARLAAGIGAVMLFIPGLQGAGTGLLVASTALSAIATGFTAGINKRIGNREARSNEMSSVPNFQMPSMAGGIVPNHNLSGSSGSMGVVRFEIEGTKLIGLIKKSEIQFK